MSKFRNGKTEDGKTKWTHFRKRKHKRSFIRQVMYIASMICISRTVDRKLEAKRKKGTLITKHIENGDKK